MNKQTGDLKVDSAKKEINIKSLKSDLDKKEKQLIAMTNLNRTLQSQIQCFKTKSGSDKKEEGKDNEDNEQIVDK